MNALRRLRSGRAEVMALADIGTSTPFVAGLVWVLMCSPALVRATRMGHNAFWPHISTRPQASQGVFRLPFALVGGAGSLRSGLGAEGKGERMNEIPTGKAG